MPSYSRSRHALSRANHTQVSGGGTISHDEIERQLARVGSTSSRIIPLRVAGVLSIGSDMAPIISTPAPIFPKTVVVKVKQAPTGADVTVEIYVGGILWLTLILPAGSLEISASDSALSVAGAIAQDANIRLDITTVGTTFAGADLVALIQAA